MIVESELAKRLENAKRRERRKRAKEQAQAGQEQPLDLREIAPHLPDLHLYLKPIVVSEDSKTALCPHCSQPLEIFQHHDRIMLMCEDCLRLWPTRASVLRSIPALVRKVIPLAEIRIRLKGNLSDWRRVYYARNRAKLLNYNRAWRSELPQEGKRYAHVYYEANKEKIIRRQLEQYHANKTEKQAKQAEYRKNNREKERARQRRWKQENPEKNRAARQKYETENRERINARKRARRAADPEKYRTYHREYRRRKQQKEAKMQSSG